MTLPHRKLRMTVFILFVALPLSVGIGVFLLWFSARGGLSAAISQAFSTIQPEWAREVVAVHDVSKGSVKTTDDVAIGYYPNLRTLDAATSVESVIGKTAPQDIHQGEHLLNSMFRDSEETNRKDENGSNKKSSASH